MHVPGWKPKWWRRAQLLWIVPYCALVWLPGALWIGLCEVGNPFGGLGDIWTGDRR